MRTMKKFGSLILGRASSKEKSLRHWPSRVLYEYQRQFSLTPLIITLTYGAQVAWYVKISFFGVKNTKRGINCRFILFYSQDGHSGILVRMMF